MHVHLNPLGGIAGDMFIASVLDTWPELGEKMVATIHAAVRPAELDVEIVKSSDRVLAGTRFMVSQGLQVEGEQRAHVRLSDIRESLSSATVSRDISSRALDIFRILAEAESSVHGIPADDVTFHEVGALDSIADIVGAAYLIEKLGPVSWSCDPLPIGSGRIQTAHGALPIPAPAVVMLLRGWPTYSDGAQGERVTPTGAAILRHIDPSFSSELPTMTLTSTGTGLGTRALPGLDNVLRLLAFEVVDDYVSGDEIAIVEFEIDDQTPEDLAIGIERIRQHRAVLDVTQTSVYGKKGRLMVQVQVLASRDELPDVGRLCLTETSTIGLRYMFARRMTLLREHDTRLIKGNRLALKRSGRPGGKLTAKPEADDMAATNGDYADRQRIRAEIEQSTPAEQVLDE